MAKPKSFLKNIAVDTAKHKHKCQHDSSHELLMGEKRLKLATGRSAEYYCTRCALDSIERDIRKLEELRNQLSGEC